MAVIHALSVPKDNNLQLHPSPAPSVLQESETLIGPYLQWEGAYGESKRPLESAFERIREFQKVEGLFEPEDLASVNYDLNTHNFVVEDGNVKLLDWEKARVAPRTKDAAHFLRPTTTLWRDEATARLTQRRSESSSTSTYSIPT